MTRFSIDHSGTYLLTVSLLTLVGYSFFLVFPVLTVCGVVMLYQAAVLTLNTANVGLGSMMIMGGIYGCAIIFQIKSTRPTGVEVDADKLPLLFHRIDQLRRHVPVARLDRVIIDGAAEIRLVRTPAATLSLRFRNTLVIGLPLLQCLGPEHIRFLLARVITKPALSSATLADWHANMIPIWLQYADQLRVGPGRYRKLLARIFFYYVHVCRTIGAPAARQAQCNADVRAAALLPGNQAGVALQSEFLLKRYLHECYWPRVQARVQQQTRLMPFAYSKLAQDYRADIHDMLPMRWFEQELDDTQHRSGLTDNLVMRLDNLGYRRFAPLAIPRVSAAEHYLGVYYFRVINTVDMLWLNRHAEQWRVQHRTHHERHVSHMYDSNRADQSAISKGRIAQVMRRRRAKAA